MKNSELMSEEFASAELKKIKKFLWIAGVFIVVLLFSVFIVWNAGRKTGKEKAAEEISKLKETIAAQEDRIAELEEEPIVVNDVAPTISLDIIKQDIKKIGELATMEYMYTDAARFSSSRKMLKGITEKSFTIKWDGVIKAGIDINEIVVDLNEEGKILTIMMPKAKILSHDPDRESVEILDESDGLFNPVRVEDQVAFEAACEKEMEQRAIENGLLDKAQENAEEIVLQLLMANPVIMEYYKIVFN